jgi:hypothetical protein
MDLDTTLTVIAGNLYRLLARKLPRYENATPDKIWRHFLDATGTRRRTGTGARARSRDWCARSAPERCTARASPTRTRAPRVSFSPPQPPIRDGHDA